MTFLSSCFVSLISLASLTNVHAEEFDVNENNIPETHQNFIAVDESVQAISGLQTLMVKRVEYQPESIGFGHVISAKPLLAIRKQLLATAFQRQEATIKYNATQQNLRRLQNLHKNAVVSTRKFQKQQSQWQTEQSRLSNASLNNELLLAESRLHWGDSLTRQFSQPTSPLVDDIIANRSQLLQIVLPAGQQLPASITRIQIAPDGHRNNAIPAEFLSAAPQVDAFTQGAVYYFLSSNSTIQPGMHVTAWIPSQAGVSQGVIIPRSALLWHLGQPFVFIKTDDETFSHRPIGVYQETAEGYFIASGIVDREHVVVQGAQMLLSHEFRSQIPDEDDDD